ncbi:MAG: NosD domain-containing protein [Ignavibacteriaceae bacterium]
MKKISTIFIFILAFNYPVLYAQIAVALHTEGVGGQRTVNYYYQSDGFHKAYADAAGGDTIYLPGGAFDPPALIEKQLVIYGAGHYPGATAATGKTIINGTIHLGAGADNVHIEGLEVSGGLDTRLDVAVNNLTVIRSRFISDVNFQGTRIEPGTTCKSVIFIGCVFDNSLQLRNVENAAVYNSVFGSTLYHSDANEFSNNIFLNSGYKIYYSNNNHFKNNIFSMSAASYLVRYSEGNIFTRNILQNSSPGYGIAAQATDNWTGIDISTLFANQSGQVFSYDHDYHLVSPETYIGTDGTTQIGIYGGVFPYKEGAVPSTPHITSSSVSPGSDAEGNIQVDITIEAQESP